MVSTVSPLWLHHADRVVLFEDGRATDDGTHEELLRDSPAYRRVVARALDAPVEEVSGHEHSRCLTRWRLPSRRGATTPSPSRLSRSSSIPPPPGCRPPRAARRPSTAATCCASSARRDTYAASRSPERGWPVADNHVVLAFFRRLLRERKANVFWLVALNALACGRGTGCIAPAGQPWSTRLPSSRGTTSAVAAASALRKISQKKMPFRSRSRPRKKAITTWLSATGQPRTGLREAA